jgi:hypothetical protein
VNKNRKRLEEIRVDGDKVLRWTGTYWEQIGEPGKQRHTTELYFEAHVTTDPIEDPDEAPGQFAWLVKKFGFRRAEFLYKKTLQVAKPDDFLTTRSTDYSDILKRTEGLVDTLIEAGYTVRRYKIENTLLDVRL